MEGGRKEGRKKGRGEGRREGRREGGGKKENLRVLVGGTGISQAEDARKFGGKTFNV